VKNTAQTKMRIFAAFAVFLASLNACMGAKILEKAAELGANTLLQFISAAELNATLEGDGPFTVFAPTDAAFAALPADLVNDLENNRTLLTEVLLYHVVSGDVRSSALANEMLADSVGGPQIRFNIYGTGSDMKVLATGSQVTLADQVADNGVIHVIDKVMMAPAGNVVEIAIANSQFSTLVTAVTTAELADSLSGGNLTVFAPTNDAFAEVDNLDDILADKDLLTKILTYHVVPSTVYSQGLSDGQEVTTLEGSRATISIEGSTVKVDDATVISANIPALNGVIHGIDKVILPDDVDPSSAHTYIPSVITLVITSVLALCSYF